jgi:quercetin dioxygenase-like cupin family protein
MSVCKGAPLGVALIALGLHGAAAQDLTSKSIFEGATTTRTTLGADAKAAVAGAPGAARISVTSWGISGDRRGNSPVQQIPLQGFYLAHLLSGEILATIDGETTRRSPGDYWAVKPGAIMQVRTIGDYAMLETTVISKQ